MFSARAALACLRKGGDENSRQRAELSDEDDDHEEVAPVDDVGEPADDEGGRGAEAEEGKGDVAPEVPVLLLLWCQLLLLGGGGSWSRCWSGQKWRQESGS